MSLLAAYHKESFGFETIEEPWGFVIFSMVQPFCRIEDIYVTPDERRKGRARELADRVSVIAKEWECTHLWSQVQMRSHKRDEALRANLAYGFQVAESDNGRIILLKELSGGIDG